MKGKKAYLIYGRVVNFKNYMGGTIPLFEDLPEKIQEAWVAVESTLAGSSGDVAYLRVPAPGGDFTIRVDEEDKERVQKWLGLLRKECCGNPQNCEKRDCPDRI